MSALVNPDALIPIVVRYIEIKNDQGQTINVRVLKDNADPVENECRINCLARGRDYDNMSKILEETTYINHISKKPVIRTKEFRLLLIEHFFVQWDAKDPNGLILSINKQSLGAMFYQLTKAIADRWLKATG